ncbi:MAG: superoxide dismutase family protein [Marinobacter sp.]|uniref:superoxide dismutase family protein n=1 Tax=Marinobacter sp. TaxID=50741 RepID=UPI003296EDDB
MLGTVRISQRASGVVIQPALEGLKPGLHGFHIHEGGSCASGRVGGDDTESPSRKPSKEAGEHWDPGLKGNHEGPWQHEHRGDLPNLYVNPDGEALLPVYAPRVSSKDFENRALVIHARRDSYSDEEGSAGGSGDAIACGVPDPG